MKSDAPFSEKQDSIEQRGIDNSDGEASAFKPAFFVLVCDGRRETGKEVTCALVLGLTCIFRKVGTEIVGGKKRETSHPKGERTGSRNECTSH